jgi:guanine deaminase
VSHHPKVLSFIEQTIDLAVANVTSNAGGPYAALIIKKDKIIAKGVNQVTMHNDPTAHAEIVTIRKACSKLNDFNLHGCILFSNCEPCPMCLGAIYWARLAQVYFSSTRDDAADAGFDDRFIYSELTLKVAERKIPMEQILHTRAAQPFNAWKQQITRIDY